MEVEAETTTCNTNDLIKLLFCKVKDFEKYRKLQCEKNQMQAQQIKDLSTAVPKLSKFVEDQLSIFEERLANRTNTQRVQDVNLYPQYINELKSRIEELEKTLCYKNDRFGEMNKSYSHIQSYNNQLLERIDILLKDLDQSIMNERRSNELLHNAYFEINELKKKKGRKP